LVGVNLHHNLDLWHLEFRIVLVVLPSVHGSFQTVLNRDSRYDNESLVYMQQIDFEARCEATERLDIVNPVVHTKKYHSVQIFEASEKVLWWVRLGNLNHEPQKSSRAVVNNTVYKATYIPDVLDGRWKVEIFLLSAVEVLKTLMVHHCKNIFRPKSNFFVWARRSKSNWQSLDHNRSGFFASSKHAMIVNPIIEVTKRRIKAPFDDLSVCVFAHLLYRKLICERLAFDEYDQRC